MIHAPRLMAAAALLMTLGCNAPNSRGPGDDPADAGARWLIAHQTPAGGWGPHGATAFATEALERLGHSAAAIRGRAWLGAVPPPRDPFAAAARVRLFECATLSLQALQGAQRGDGRWHSPDHPDALMTALALTTLARAGAKTDRESLQRARAWLLEQSAPAAWKLAGVAEPARAAAQQVRAARAAQLLDVDRVEARSLRQLGHPEPRAGLLAAAHRLDASWPEQAHARALGGAALSPHDLLGLLLVTEALTHAPRPRRDSWDRAARHLLRSQQRRDGSWCGSALGTAAALLALDRLLPAGGGS